MSTSISHLILSGTKPPAVFWREQAKQFMTYIYTVRATLILPQSPPQTASRQIIVAPDPLD